MVQARRARGVKSFAFYILPDSTTQLLCRVIETIENTFALKILFKILFFESKKIKQNTRPQKFFVSQNKNQSVSHYECIQ
jgi:ABC-type uncharacterized transport system substrate-binding protein